jgi:hypothetical protein
MRIVPGFLAVLALGLAVGPALSAPPPERTAQECGIASLCSANTAYDMNRKGWRVHGLRTDRPARRACDQNGFNCRYTHDYFISDDGNAQYGPGGGKPVTDE